MNQIPNLISLLRLFSAPYLAWLLIHSHFQAALIGVLAAGATDWLDGWSARKLKVSSKAGAYLDPIADKAMLVILFIALHYGGLIPPWLLWLVLGRDFVIVSGALALRIVYGLLNFPPTPVGKVSTFFQIIAVLLVMIHAALGTQTMMILKQMALAETTFFTALSGLDYILIGIRLTREAAARVACSRVHTSIDGSKSAE